MKKPDSGDRAPKAITVISFGQSPSSPPKAFMKPVLRSFARAGALIALCSLGSALVRVGAGQAAAEEDAKKPKGFYYDPAGHRDPFVPLVRDGRLVGISQPTSKETTFPVLYGILWDPGGQSIALINDGEAKVGDTITGYQVKEIRKDAVVLSNGGEPLVLQIVYDAPAVKPPSGATTGGGSR